MPVPLALHAARRLTFGATPDVVASITQRGLAGWVDDQLRGLPDPSATIAHVDAGTLPLPAVVLGALEDQTEVDVLRDLRRATFARVAWGDHQLVELLVEFWGNHLSIAGDEVRAHKAVDDREVVRAHALGTFSDMLVASAQSPAMLLYLDGASSRSPQPNENYARELLELHTVGVHGGYRQRDVVDAAKALTGLTVDAATGMFTYRAEWHVTGPLRVLGWSHANADAGDGLDVAASLLRYLAAHPSTALHLATKLVRRLVADQPPRELVESTAAAYLAAGTGIVATVRHVVLSSQFAAGASRKTQRGLEWLALAIRALRLEPDRTVDAAADQTLELLTSVGQVPFGWHPPDGYPDTAVDWASTSMVLGRWNAAQALVRGRVAGVSEFDPDSLLGTPLPSTVGALVDRLVPAMLCQAPGARLRTALVRSTGRTEAAVVDADTARQLTPSLAALVLSSPEAQVR